MSIQSFTRNGVCSIVISGREAPTDILEYVLGRPQPGDCSACIVNINRYVADPIAASIIYQIFQRVEERLRDYLNNMQKPLAFIEPVDSESANAFQSFFALMSNYLEWSVRDEAKLIRCFACLNDAMEWISSFSPGETTPRNH